LAAGICLFCRWLWLQFFQLGGKFVGVVSLGDDLAGVSSVPSYWLLDPAGKIEQPI
jgi:hypothetical protein